MGFLDRLREGLTRTKQQIVTRFEEIVQQADAVEQRSRPIDVDTVEAELAAVKAETDQLMGIMKSLGEAKEGNVVTLDYVDGAIGRMLSRIDAYGPLTSRFVDRLIDGVGAGDALLAYATLTMLATDSDVLATIVGTMAAACECEREGNVPVTVEDIHQKIDMVEREAKFS